MSIFPNLSTTFLKASATSLSLFKLGYIPRILSLYSLSLSRALLTLSSLLPNITTFALFSKNNLAVAKPIPLVAPVITATLPFNILSPS